MGVTILAEMLEHLPYLATAATVFAALVAFRRLRLQRLQEKNKISFLKHQSEVEHLQKLIASLSRVIAVAHEEWSDERNRALDDAIEEMQFHVVALQSLSNVVSADIDKWATDKDQDGNSISATIYYELGNLHVGISGPKKRFMQFKMDALKKIQDKLFSSMTKL